MAIKYIYEVYDKKTNRLIHVGSSSSVRLFLDCDKATLSKITLGQAKRSQYRIIRKVDDSVKEKKISVYSYAKRHLDKYGNTVILKKQKHVLKKLEKNGYKIKVKDGIYADDYYILELISK